MHRVNVVPRLSRSARSSPLSIPFSFFLYFFHLCFAIAGGNKLSEKARFMPNPQSDIIPSRSRTKATIGRFFGRKRRRSHRHAVHFLRISSTLRALFFLASEGRPAARSPPRVSTIRLCVSWRYPVGKDPRGRDCRPRISVSRSATSRGREVSLLHFICLFLSLFIYLFSSLSLRIL